MRHHVAGVENAGVDLSARYGKGGQCGRKKTCPSKLKVKLKNNSIKHCVNRNCVVL